MTDKTLTKAQREFFLEFTKDAVRGVYPSVSVEQIDFLPMAMQLGQAILGKVPFSQVKAVDKFMKSEQYTQVIGAIQFALAQFTIPEVADGETQNSTA